MSADVDLTPYREQYTYYSKRLLSDLGLGDLRQPERGQLLASIENYVQQVILNSLLENVTEASIDGAEEILNNGGSQEEVMTYLITTTPNVEVIMANSLAETYAKMLTEAKELTKAIIKKAEASPAA